MAYPLRSRSGSVLPSTPSIPNGKLGFAIEIGKKGGNFPLMNAALVPSCPKRKVGRPSKRTPDVVKKIATLLRRGHSVARSARKAGVHPKTVQRWLTYDLEFLKAVAEAQTAGLRKARKVAWTHHPFRGRRPPRPAHLRNKPYPKPAF